MDAVAGEVDTGADAKEDRGGEVVGEDADNDAATAIANVLGHAEGIELGLVNAKHRLEGSGEVGEDIRAREDHEPDGQDEACPASAECSGMCSW